MKRESRDCHLARTSRRSRSARTRLQIRDGGAQGGALLVAAPFVLRRELAFSTSVPFVLAHGRAFPAAPPLLLLFLSCAIGTPIGVSAAEYGPLDPPHWGVVYDVPATKDVVLRAGVPYLRDERGTLTLDLYLPPSSAPGHAGSSSANDASSDDASAGDGSAGDPSAADPSAGELLPAVVFINGVGDRPDDHVKDWAIYQSWPRLVAAHGLVGISMDSDGERIDDCLRAALAFLADHGREHGIDGDRIGVYASSANVTAAAAMLFSDDPPSNVRCAALYYPQPPPQTPRKDLPVLFIFAEGDVGGAGTALTDLWERVVEQRAPWTLAFASKLPHGFDAFEDVEASRALIRQTLSFWKSHLEPTAPRDNPAQPARAILSAIYAHEPERAVTLLGEWIAAHPGESSALVQRGRMLGELGRHEDAILDYQKAIELGSRDPMVQFGKGTAHMMLQQWDDSQTAFLLAAENGMQTSLLYWRLGLTQLYLSRNEEAVQSYEKAFELGIPPGANFRGSAWYNLACGYARLGQIDKALDALAGSVQEGFAKRDMCDADPDLAPLREHARYREILAQAEANTVN